MNRNEKTVKVSDLEIVTPGFANGVSVQLQELIDKGEFRSLNDTEKEEIISNATHHYGEFLRALGCTWESDPNSNNTPRRVAKA